MSRRTRRRAGYYDRTESSVYSTRGASYFQDASGFPDRDLYELVSLPPVLPSIRRFALDPGELEVMPGPVLSYPSVSWVDPPPKRPTLAQEPRRAPPLRGSSARSAAALLRPLFAHPEAVGLCVRRKQRREVIFARTGGGRGMPPRRRTQDSQYSC